MIYVLPHSQRIGAAGVGASGNCAGPPWVGRAVIIQKADVKQTCLDWTLSVRSCSPHPGCSSNFPTTLEHSEPAVALTSSSFPCQAPPVIGPRLHNEWETSRAKALGLRPRELSWLPPHPPHWPWGTPGRYGIWAGSQTRRMADRECSNQTNDWKAALRTSNIKLCLLTTKPKKTG